MAGVAVLAALLAGCEASDEPPGDRPDAGAPAATGEPTASQPAETRDETPDDETPNGSPGEGEGPTESSSPSEEPERDEPARFRRAAAMDTVRFLAGRVGPREATTAAYRRAARRVGSRLRALGYDVSRQPFRAPRGVSWGVPVPAGRTWNVVATPEGFRPTRPHLLIGAHLDTVPQAPGAEDNASGVAVLLEVARLGVQRCTRLPVVFVAFGAEEPRGEGDAMHHFGSRTYVQQMSRREQRALRGMVSMDRVGVGSVVPVCTGGVSPFRVRAQLVNAAERLDIPVQTCADNASSDHWQFELAGEAAARLGSTPYAGYHSPGDVPSVVNPRQLGRVGRIAWEWLRD